MSASSAVKPRNFHGDDIRYFRQPHMQQFASSPVESRCARACPSPQTRALQTPPCAGRLLSSLQPLAVALPTSSLARGARRCSTLNMRRRSRHAADPLPPAPDLVKDQLETLLLYVTVEDQGSRY